MLFCAIASKIYLIFNIIKLGQGKTTLLADGLLLCPTTTMGVTNFRSEPQTFKLIVQQRESPRAVCICFTSGRFGVC